MKPLIKRWLATLLFLAGLGLSYNSTAFAGGPDYIKNNSIKKKIIKDYSKKNTLRTEKQIIDGKTYLKFFGHMDYGEPTLSHSLANDLTHIYGRKPTAEELNKAIQYTKILTPGRTKDYVTTCDTNYIFVIDQETGKLIDFKIKKPKSKVKPKPELKPELKQVENKALYKIDQEYEALNNLYFSEKWARAKDIENDTLYTTTTAKLGGSWRAYKDKDLTLRVSGEFDILNEKNGESENYNGFKIRAEAFNPNIGGGLEYRVANKNANENETDNIILGILKAGVGSGNKSDRWGEFAAEFEVDVGTDQNLDIIGETGARIYWSPTDNFGIYAQIRRNLPIPNSKNKPVNAYNFLAEIGALDDIESSLKEQRAFERKESALLFSSAGILGCILPLLSCLIFGMGIYKVIELVWGIFSNSD